MAGSARHVCMFIFICRTLLRHTRRPLSLSDAFRESYVRTCSFYQPTKTIRLAFMSCQFRRVVTQSEIGH